MVSVNTNIGAQIALQNLTATQAQLNTTQQRITTGLAVSSPKDNGGLFAIAQNLRADVGSLTAVKQSLDRASSAVDVAISAGQTVSDLLVEMKQKAIGAADASLDAASRSALNEDFKSLRDQIQTVVDNAAFNGVNLLDGTGTNGTNLQAIADAKQSSHITVNVENLSYGGGTLTISSTQQIDTQANASTTAASIDTSLSNVNKALARLGTGSKKLSLHETFVGKLSDTLNAGIGNLVDADLASESAKLQSLQVKQQLGVQALSIANQAPQILLSLFR
jgi:flagellin